VSDIVIVATGLANTASVVAAFKRLGAAPLITRDAAEVQAARAVVVPGVGAFGPGMQALRDASLVDLLRERVAADRPTAGICLGMQLLFATSDETPGATGLGIIDAHVARFADTLTVPQMGWNQVAAPEGARFFRDGFAYFANSYRAVPPLDGWRCATADYGGTFVAGIERGATVGCQFHPELSGRWGLALLRRWLDAAGVSC
jgi:glutamine amidotransferase